MTSALLDSLRELPGGAQLLDAAAATGLRGRAHLVGGSVRDLLRGVEPRELDVVVEGDIAPLLEALGGAEIVHDRFGTASASAGGARVDVTTSRRERYPRPGALPEVEPAPLAEDLLRRDFTVNAIAVSLPQGELRAAPHAEEDLAAGLLRVLHEESFIDDPTRLWRLGRYAARLRFRPQEHTAELARAAIAQGGLASVSGSRIGAELRLALAEEDGPGALAELRALGVLRAAGIEGGLEEGTMRAALALLPDDGRADLLLLAALLTGVRSEEEISALLDRLAFPASDRERVLASVQALPRLRAGLPVSSQPSHVYALAAGTPIEAVALAGALGSPGEDGSDAQLRVNAERWLGELRD